MPEFFIKLLSLLKKPSPLLACICLVTGFVIFASDNLLIKFSILDFKNTYSTYLGVTFLICLSLLIMYFILFILKKIKDIINYIRYLIIRRKNLLQLNPEQFHTVVQLYYRQNHSANLDITQSTTNLLEHYQIIGRASNLGTAFTYFSYYLQPWVIKYINSHHEFTKNIPSDSVPNEWVDW